MTIRLVCGPPAAGKTTYVKEKAGENDLVIDLDSLRAVYGDDVRAKHARKSLEASVGDYDGDVWVIRTLASGERRTDAAKRLGATETVVIATPAELAKQRAAKRDPNKDLSEPIDRWWNQYSMVQSDLIVSPDMEQLSDKEKTMAMRKPTQLKFAEGDEGGNGGGGSDKDLGFPKDTPLVEMTEKQQVAYWKHHARKHEGVATSRADYDQQKADAEKWRQAQDQNKTPDQKAIDDAVNAAREETRKEELKKLAPRLVNAEFKSLAKDVPKELLDAFLEDVNHALYLNDDGDVNTEKVQKRVDALTPKGVAAQRRDNHQGYRKNDGATGVANGRDLFASRQKKK